MVFCVPKPQVGGFGCPSWFIYGIRLLAKQFLGTFLDIEVDQSAVNVSIITREVEEILVDSSEELGRFEVDVAKPLEVERSPGYEEEKDNTG